MARALAVLATGAISSLRASTMITPPKPGDRRAPTRSKAVAERITMFHSSGGTCSAASVCSCTELPAPSVRRC